MLRLSYSLLDEMIDINRGDKTVSTVNGQVLAPRYRADCLNIVPGEGFCQNQRHTQRCLREIFQLVKKLSTAESKEIESLHKTFSQRLEETSKLSLDKLYNPLGKKFISSVFDERAGVTWSWNMDLLDRLISRIRVKIEQ